MSDASPSGASALELIRLREQLTAWIAKLDEVGTQASSHVAERVRADYRERLARVNDELGAHREEIEADLQRFRGAREEAEARRGAAGEALEETRLRHLIGELDDAAWEAARPSLEAEVSGADDAVAHARAEVARLEALSADVGSAAAAAAEAAVAPAGELEVVWTPEEDAAAERQAEVRAEPEPLATADEPSAAAPPAPEPAPPADAREAADAAGAETWDPFGGEFGVGEKPGDAGEDLPWLSGIDDPAKEWTAPGEDSGLEFLRGIDEPGKPAAGAEPAAGLGADDLAFLEELDRSIGGATPRPPAPATPTPPKPPAEEPTPAPGSRNEPLLCKECGAINEAHAWYCEICGSEL